MKKRQNMTAKRAFRVLEERELQAIQGGNGVDIGSMQQMMDQSFAQQLEMQKLQQAKLDPIKLP